VMETATEVMESMKSIQKPIQTAKMSLGTILHLNLWMNRLTWARTTMFHQNHPLLELKHHLPRLLSLPNSEQELVELQF